MGPGGVYGIEDYLATVPDESRRKDCQALSDLMARVVGESPKMWGPSIVGFGSSHYRYESGREGEQRKINHAC